MPLVWSQHSTGTGYKVVKAYLQYDTVDGSAIVRKGDGTKLTKVSSPSSFTGIDQQCLQQDYLYVSIPDTVTDFQSYFSTNVYTVDYDVNDRFKLGAIGDKKDILWKDGQDWKVLKWVEKSETLTITNNTATLANNAQADTAIIVDESTGEIYKRVVALSGSGKEFTQGGSGNKTITFNEGYVPTSPKAHYVLATPQTIVVTDKVEGDLVVNGQTQIEVGSGVVIREKVIPYLDANNIYRINNHWGGNSDLKYKTTKILKIYKSSIDNTSVWTIINDNDNGYANGNAWACTQKTNFDQAAEYTVTYLLLDRHLFTANILAVTATYDSSLKSVVDSVVAKQSDIAATVSVNVRAIAELYKRVKALGG
ncbi:Uncharacterised protein [[Flavobacterium] thermophilum]|nr:Uncharacterised protein [[Flavobacterium] thermophilum]